jgi:hypothetical protein
VLERCPGHPGATTALADLPLAPPAWVSAARDHGGDVLVLWGASSTAGVIYKVSRQRPDGGWQVLGRVDGTSLDDGGAPPGVEAPVYSVEAVQAGRSSAPTRSDGPVLAATAPPGTPTPTPTGAGSSVPPRYRKAPRAEPSSIPTPATTQTPAASPQLTYRPRSVRAVRLSGGSVLISWTGPAGAQYRVRAQSGSDSWRVVGRTSDTAIEDGGAPAGPVPVYAVSATVGQIRSDETRSDEARSTL